MDSVLVFSGCYNKIQRLRGLNNRNLFLLVLEAGKSKIKVLAHVVPGESSPPGLQMVPSHCVLTWPFLGPGGEGAGGSKLFGISSYNPTGLGPYPVTSFNLNL